MRGVEIGSQPPGHVDDGLLLKAAEVLTGPVEAIRMIDAETGDQACPDEAGHQAMGGLEDLRHLHPDGGEVVHVEEPPVIDLVAGHPPVGQTIRLLSEERVEEIEAGGVARRAVERGHVVLDEDLEILELLHEAGQPPLDDLLLAGQLFAPGRVGLGPGGQVVDGGEDAHQIVEARMILPQTLVQSLETMAKDTGVGVRGQGQPCPGIADKEATFCELQGESPRLEGRAVLVGQHRQQQRVAKRGAKARPVDVEESRIAGCGAGLEHVEPPGIGIAGDAHVVRHDVEHHPEASLGERLGHRFKGGDRADLGIEAAVIHDVVPVTAPRSGAEAGRQVDLADPECVEVGGELGHTLEGEGRAELQAIGRPPRSVESLPDALEKRRPVRVDLALQRSLGWWRSLTHGRCHWLQDPRR